MPNIFFIGGERVSYTYTNPQTVDGKNNCIIGVRTNVTYQIGEGRGIQIHVFVQGSGETWNGIFHATIQENIREDVINRRR